MTVTSKAVSDDELRALARHYLRGHGRDLQVEIERGPVAVRLIFAVSHRGEPVGGGEILGFATNAADWWRQHIAAVAA